MCGNMFAVSMIAALCGTLVLLKVYGRRLSRSEGYSGLLVGAATLLLFTIVAFGHLCDRGGPTGAVFLGTLSAGFLRATVEKKVWRRTLWFAWFVLVCFGTHICHLDGYVGNSHFGLTRRQMADTDLRRVQELLRGASQDRKGLDLPEGWLDESWLRATGESIAAICERKTASTKRLWHTWFTGIFSLQTQRYGIWCPGGPIGRCAESLEIRPRQREP
jgi:hypothetical protein